MVSAVPSRFILLPLLAVLALLASACGVSVEAEPRPLPSGAQVPLATSSPAPSPTQAPTLVDLKMVQDAKLVQVDRDVESTPTSQDRLDLLAAGPTEEEAERGIRTAVVSVVTGSPLAITAEAAFVSVIGQVPENSVAVVLQPEFIELPAEEQLLVLGQVVQSLAVGEVQSVLFVDVEGTTLGVPLPDGQLVTGTVTPRDYEALNR